MAPKRCPTCPKCKGVHKELAVIDCPAPYPHYKNQICDNCGSEEHENDTCTVTELYGFRKTGCKHCGHPACRERKPMKCQIVGDRRLKELTQDQYDQFTPIKREEWMRKYSAPSDSSLATGPSSAAAVAHASNPVQSQDPPQSSEIAETTTVSIEDPYEGMTESQKERAQQQERWDQELPNITKAPSTKVTDSSKADLVKTNFFKVSFDKHINLNRYSVSLGPIGFKSDDQNGEWREYVPTNRDTKRFLINSMLSQSTSVPPIAEGTIWASDFEATIVSVGDLYPGLTTANPTQEVQHYRTGPGGTEVSMISKVKLLGPVSIATLMSHCRSPCGTNPTEYLPDKDLQALNIISWKLINSDAFQGGRRGKKFYPNSLLDPNQEDDKANKLYLFRKGFFSSMRPGQKSVLLNINTTTSAFYSPIRLSRWIQLKWEDDQPPATEFRRLLNQVRVTFEAEKPEKQRKRAVFGISPNNLKGTKFALDKTKPNEQISVLEYFKSKEVYSEHSAQFDENDYCINLGNNSERRWYPASLLHIVDWQPITRALEKSHAAEMVQIAELNPSENQRQILDHAIPWFEMKNRNGFLKRFGINMASAQFLQLKPVYAQAPRLLFRSSRARTPALNTSTWRLSNLQFKETKPLSTLHMLWLCERLSDEALLQFLENLTRLGLTKANGAAITLSHGDATAPQYSQNYRDDCKNVLQQAYANLRGPGTVQLLVIVLAEADRSLYPEIKRWADCEAGVATSCVTRARLAAVGDWNTAANIILKFNLKLGGVSHETEALNSSGKLRDSTMIIGADVTHPLPESAKGGCPSIAAVVATNDNVSNQYLGSARLQKGKQEFISDLESMIEERLMAWYDKNRGLPANILFYRDGVSESQYTMVRSEELPQISKACRTVYKDLRKRSLLSTLHKYEPNITLLVVTKRHHTRFYPADGSAENNLNPRLIVDGEIVPPANFGWFGQAHESPLGTARSSYYVVLQDGSNYRNDPQKLQQITNTISYTSARATQALAVCPPARYADILCDRVRCYMKPALEGQHRPSTLPGEEEMDANTDYSDHYIEDRKIWKGAGGDANWKNPWHPNLKDIMFYL